jgi:copper(I)-binding protein
MFSGRFSIVWFLLTCCALSACSADLAPPLVASNLEITASMPGGEMSAGYFALTNNTDDMITISSVVSAEFESVEIHESLLENGVAKMRRIPALSIPANSTVTLERGGKHLMLKRPVGNATQVSLKFLSGDTLLLGIQAPISSRNN